MTVKELIEKLKLMPQDAQVGHVWDGSHGTGIEFVWETKDGRVLTADNGEVVYSNDDRPSGAPTVEEERYWTTPKEEY